MLLDAKGCDLSPICRGHRPRPWNADPSTACDSCSDPGAFWTEQKEPYCVSVLDLAVEEENLKILQMLLDRIDRPFEGNGILAFYYAGKSQNLAVLRQLISKPKHRSQCIDLLVSSECSWGTPLHLVCLPSRFSSNTDEQIDILLNLAPMMKADMLAARMATKPGWTPLASILRPRMYPLDHLGDYPGDHDWTIYHLIKRGASILELSTADALFHLLYLARELDQLFIHHCIEASFVLWPDDRSAGDPSRANIIKFWLGQFEKALDMSVALSGGAITGPNTERLIMVAKCLA